MDDVDSTTVVLKRNFLRGLRGLLRDEVTFKALWGVVTALVIAIGWVINAQVNVHRLQESVSDLQKDRELLQTINTNIAAMSSKIDGIAKEVDYQHEEWDRVHNVAESPPHPRRKP